MYAWPELPAMRVEVLEALDGWYRIESGYISAEYVTVSTGQPPQAAPLLPPFSLKSRLKAPPGATQSQPQPATLR